MQTGLVAPLALALLTAAAPLAAQRGRNAPATPPQAGAPALPMNASVAGTLGTGGEAAKYSFTATGAGLLTVAANAPSDITIAIMDEDGQMLREGAIDRDHAGNVGREYGTVVIPRAGKYAVEIRGLDASGSVAFTVGGSVVAMAALELPEDPDGRPAFAKAVQPGVALEDQVNPDAGDAADWYSVTAETSMTLVIVTRVEEEGGDLVIEAFSAGDMSQSVGRSDQDLRGNPGNESVTVEMRAGETVKFKVFALNERGGVINYRVSLGMVP
jgi:hypothetical protein